MPYNHTQSGNLIRYVSIALGIYFLFIWIKSGLEEVILIFAVIILAFVSSFGSLNVMIDKKYLQIKFTSLISIHSFVNRNTLYSKPA